MAEDRAASTNRRSQVSELVQNQPFVQLTPMADDRNGGTAVGILKPPLAERTRGGGRLFRYDRRIALNVTRATFSGWHDRLIAATLLLFALAVVRAWFMDRAWPVAAWASLGAGVIIGLTAGHLIVMRLGFHAFDGPLPADALRRSTRRRYMISWHASGLAILASVTLVARPSLLIASLPGYLMGAVVGHGTGGFALPGLATGKAELGREIRSGLLRPRAGIVAAAILLLSLLPAHTVGTSTLMAIVCIEAVLLTLALTIVDDGIVRFMTVAGHGPWRIIVHHARGMLLFVGVTVPACWLAFGPVATGIVAAAAVAMLLLTMRVLAYRLHGKRFADLLVSIFAGLLMLVAYAMPIALPFVALAIVWQLQRRAAAKTWLLA